ADCFLVACEKETVCTLELEFPEGGSAKLEIVFPKTAIHTRMTESPIQVTRLLFPKGSTPLRIEGHAESYRCTLKVEDRGEFKEVEPNDCEEEAIEILEGQTWRGQRSGYPAEQDWYRFQVKTAGPLEVILKSKLGTQAPYKGTLTVTSGAPGIRQYTYQIDLLDDEFHFYPVLDPGAWLLQLTNYEDRPVGDAYELTVKPHSNKVTEGEKKAAEAAIERGVRYLLKIPERREENMISAAAESMALAALSEGRGARERRDALDRDFVSWLDQRFVKTGEVEAYWVERGIYTHTMATLGLAEAAANGSEKAKELARRAAHFLILSQNTERKPKEWNGPVAKRAKGYGGWRYDPESVSTDLSIAGWGIIALTAVDAAGVKVEGLRDAIEAAIEGVEELGDERGFGYENPSGASDIHGSIGALVHLLYGIESTPLDIAKRHLDAYLWAGTQVDRGEDYPFYYLYYATRAQYLRGGDVWETWRSTALRQLLHRQKEDGSWAGIHFESQPGPRWTTAVGVMMLRLCLNEPPKYLRVEAKGF
ncbi:MAG TPA: hypothetical protein VFS19_01630, partial [Planctomycetota bacterium]|nr:hypothetical protein [Planctomycetota bacterium]